MRFSGSVLSSFILFVSSFSPFGRVLSQIVATFLGLSKCGVVVGKKVSLVWRSKNINHHSTV